MVAPGDVPAPAAPAPAPAQIPATRAEDVRVHVPRSSVEKPVSAGTHLDGFGNLVDEHGARVWPEAYHAARKEAEDHAVERGKCFEESKKAFEEGRKAEAKELSERGKEHGALMEAANKRAAGIVLEPQHLDKADRIDLHGLLVHEAVEATKDFVKSCTGRLKTVEVITGQGLHSDKAKGPVIKPAIFQLCKDENWQHEISPHNPGCIIVSVPPSK